MGKEHSPRVGESPIEPSWSGKGLRACSLSAVFRHHLKKNLVSAVEEWTRFETNKLEEFISNFEGKIENLF